jgi:hypothetical protein
VQQIVEFEGLSHVVIDSGRGPTADVLGRIARRQHQNGSLLVQPTNIPRYLKAILLRQHEIEQDYIVSADIGELDRGVPVLGPIHEKTFLTKALLQESTDFAIVLYQQDPHYASVFPPLLNEKFIPSSFTGSS